MTAATWWDNSSMAGAAPIVRHAPDDTGYYAPDAEHLRKLGGGPVRGFATIPAANQDGTSKGFVAGEAGPVHVDPEAPDGGVIFDPRQAQPGQIEAALATSHYPHQVFYQLGRSARAAGEPRPAAAGTEPARVNPIMPGAYVVPASGIDGRQVVQESPMPPVSLPTNVPAVQAPTPAPAPAPPPLMPMPAQAPWPAPTLPQPAYPQYALPDPNMMALMQQVANTLNGMQQQINVLRQAPAPQPQPQPPTTGLSPVPLPHGVPTAFDGEARPIRQRRNTAGDDSPASLVSRAQERRQTVDDYRRADAPENPLPGVITGFETLRIPWITGPIANKAKVQVYFDIPNAGKHMARYHEVVDGGRCVVLIYDTRYEDGDQYLPPELAVDAIVVLDVPSQKKQYAVHSLGYHWEWGAFTFIFLAKAASDEVDYPQQ